MGEVAGLAWKEALEDPQLFSPSTVGSELVLSPASRYHKKGQAQWKMMNISPKITATVNGMELSGKEEVSGPPGPTCSLGHRVFAQVVIGGKG